MHRLIIGETPMKKCDIQSVSTVFKYLMFFGRSFAVFGAFSQQVIIKVRSPVFTTAENVFRLCACDVRLGTHLFVPSSIVKFSFGLQPPPQCSGEPVKNLSSVF
jgi:hypothetical protein